MLYASTHSILSQMLTGEVVFFNEDGGYGFIESEDYDDDVYYHMAEIDGPDLEEGQKVEFEVEEADKGPRAENVTRLDDDEVEE